MTDTLPLSDPLRAFADRLRDAYDLPPGASAWPEEQLKRHTAQLIEDAAAALGVTDVLVLPEAPVEGIGRPDLGVYVGGLLVGHVELKKPGTGANAPRFKGRDKKQWEKFKRLPNVVYTDGLQFAHFARGEREGPLVKLDGDPRDDGAEAVSDADARALGDLFRAFLGWEPAAPKSPKDLAELLAPIARLLREDVEEALKDPDSPLSHLAPVWRRRLFPDATDHQFADAYAQTLTYALLLAHFSGADDLSTDDAAEALRPGHSLLSEALRVLGDPRARKALGSTVSLLERVISGVNPAIFEKQGALVEDGPAHAADPWLYFYEDFLAAYDPKMRKDRGVYYTPWQVVQAQVRLTARLLDAAFDKPYGVASDGVVTLDPACGTGTYLLAAVRHGLDLVAARGRSVGQAATRAAEGTHAFELLVGPYAVAHLRLTQQVQAAGGTLPADGAHIYLTDTLEDPDHVPRVQGVGLNEKELAEEHRRAQRVKAHAPVLLCLGNPPYDREQAEDGREIVQRKGRWVRFGHVITKAGKDTKEVRSRPILDDFTDPLTASGDGVHAKNLYNDYVYFWRWALWKTVGPASRSDGGIVSFITASSYLRGPGFKGMRAVMRETFDDLWVLDLGGDNLGARKSDNVFAIQTPVCVATGVRYRDGDARRTAEGEPARVHHARVEGAEAEKLERLRRIGDFEDVDWDACPTGWAAPFLPARSEAYLRYPALTDLFPWQAGGVKIGRKWPMASDYSALERRWHSLLSTEDRTEAFVNRPTGRKADDEPDVSYLPAGPAIATLPKDAPIPEVIPYAYRSFDRQHLIADARLIDRASPTIWKALAGPRSSYQRL